MLTNPYAGRYEPDILPMMDALQPVGLDMARRLLAAMAVPAERIEGYGKGAIIGAAGEQEHGALWHVPGGYAMRELLGWKGDAAAYARGEGSGQSGNALAIVPSTKKVGAPGATLDVPLTHINASYVRSHFDAMEVRVPGAPRPDEMVVILAMSTGARVHARVGGLAAPMPSPNGTADPAPTAHRRTQHGPHRSARSSSRSTRSAARWAAR